MRFPIYHANDSDLRSQISSGLNTLGDRIGGPEDWINPPYTAVANRWQGPWVQKQYYYGDQVVDGLWLAIANKDTDLKPAPVPVGGESWLYDNNPVWTTAQHTGNVFSGTQLIPSGDFMISVNGFRTWVQDAGDPNARYRFITYNFITDTFNIGEEFGGDIRAIGDPGWVEINITPELVFGGDNFVFVLQQWNSSANTDLDYAYVRAANSQNQVSPGPGEFNRDQQIEVFRLDEIDNDGIDRGPTGDGTLDLIIPGTDIRYENAADSTQWVDLSVVAVNYLGGWYEMNVLFVDQGPGGEPAVGTTCRVKISIPTPVPTTYVSLAGQWAGDPVLNGYFNLDSITGGTFSDTGYGVDIKYQVYNDSPDWDLQALSSTQLPQTGQAVSFGPGVNVIDSTDTTHFWDRWTDASKELLWDYMNRVVVPPGPPPSRLEAFRAQQFFAYTAERIVSVRDPYVIQEINWLVTVFVLTPAEATAILQT